MDDFLIQFADAILSPEKASKEIAQRGKFITDSPKNQCSTVAVMSPTQVISTHATMTALSAESTRSWPAIIKEISMSLSKFHIIPLIILRFEKKNFPSLADEFN